MCKQQVQNSPHLLFWFFLIIAVAGFIVNGLFSARAMSF